MTTCLRHRDLFGSRWQSGRPICTIPDEIAAHKSSSVKGLCGSRSNQSAYVYFILSQLVPTGSRKSHGTVWIPACKWSLYRKWSPNWTANDPKTGNDSQRLYRKRWYLRRNQSWPMKEMSGLRNLDKGFISSIFSLKITNSQFKCNRCYS